MRIQNLLIIVLSLATLSCATVVKVATGTSGYYQVEGNLVTYSSWNPMSLQYSVFAMPEADAESFEQLSQKYGRDKSRVYKGRLLIEGADSGSFSLLNDYYAMDKKHGYVQGKVLPHSDAKSLVILGGNWARDKNDYYYGAAKLNVCDIESFRIIRPERGLDSLCYFFMGRPVAVESIDSLQLLPASYAKDSSKVYWGDRVIEEADSASFLVKDDSSISIARDSKQCYSADRVLVCTDLNESGREFCGC